MTELNWIIFITLTTLGVISDGMVFFYLRDLMFIKKRLWLMLWITLTVAVIDVNPLIVSPIISIIMSIISIISLCLMTWYFVRLPFKIN